MHITCVTSCIMQCVCICILCKDPNIHLYTYMHIYICMCIYTYISNRFRYYPKYLQLHTQVCSFRQNKSPHPHATYTPKGTHKKTKHRSCRNSPQGCFISPRRILKCLYLFTIEVYTCCTTYIYACIQYVYFYRYAFSLMLLDMCIHICIYINTNIY